MRRAAVLAMALVVVGCTTTQAIRRPGGATEYLVACGAATGWDVCYARANELCPDGYETLAQEGGFNRKELRIGCASPARRR